MTDKQKVLEFERKIRQIRKRALRLDNETRRACEAIIRETSRKIQELILASAPAEGAFPARVVIPLNGQIGREVNLMTTQLLHMIDNGQNLQWQAALNAGAETAYTLGFNAAFFHPTPELLVVAKSYTADLIKTIPQEFMKDVNGLLSRGALGALSPVTVMQEMDKLIGKGGANGVSYQVERITRTEIERIYSIALDTQIQAFADALPPEAKEKLYKEWISGPWRPGRREQHQEMDEQKVLVDEPFICPDGEQLMYPRDPAGSAGQTINCGCSWALVAESIEDVLVEL